ncbi:MAG: GNAT family N-acetyltransferase [Micromonosporaceae bacterium]
MPAAAGYNQEVTDDIAINVARAEDWDAFYASMSTAFNEAGDPETAEADRAIFEPARSLVARDGDEIVGTAGIQTRHLAVPGGTVAAGHVTMVTVAPTARRRGLLTRFMHQQFADIGAAGEPIAALWASEGRIYQRFGYGLACRRLTMTIDTREVRLNQMPEAPGRLRSALAADVGKDLVDLYAQAYPHRPGWSQRHERTWHQLLADPPSRWNGWTARRALLHEGTDGIDGYALWRAKSHWDGGGPAGEVRVHEVVALNPDAYASLWQFLLNVDLTRTTSQWIAAIDEPLVYLVNEPRRLGLALGDALWVRIIDVPGALTARRYAAPLELVLEVEDELIPANAGRWQLTATPEKVTCTSTVEPPDLELDIRALGAVYLGDAVLGGLAGAGRVTERRPGALITAAAAFTWPQAPSTVETF